MNNAPPTFKITRKLAGVGTSVFSEMSRLAAEHGAINLAQGFPDFDGPAFVKEAAMRALEHNSDQYAPAHGRPELRRAVAEARAEEYGLRYDPDHEVTVGCGATELLFATVQALCDVGDEVVLFEPFYDSYRAAVWMAGATPRVVTLRAPNWTWDEAQLVAAFSPRTRLVIVNTPHNPTGKIFSRAELAQIATLCERYDVVCLADEVYEHLVYDGVHVPVAAVPGMAARTVTVSSLSKSYSLTGWRVGWALAPPPLTTALRLARQFVTFAAPAPLQVAAATAVTEGQAYRAMLREFLRRQREVLREALVNAGLTPYPSQGSYFLCAGFEQYAFNDDREFCDFLTRRVKVTALPPSAFYENQRYGRSYVRFVFCKKEATLHEATVRLRGLPALR